MVSLKELHSFRFNVFAHDLTCIEDLRNLDSIKYDDQCLILGEGTNVAFIEDFQGRLISLQNKELKIDTDAAEFRVHAGAGYQWHQLVCDLLNRDVFGLENLALIPGTAGAAPIQNIGAYGAEFSQFCDYVDVYDLKEKVTLRFETGQCQFGYRDSVFKRAEYQHLLITGIGLKFPRTWRPNLSYKGLDHLPVDSSPQQVCDAVIRLRMSKLPDHRTLGNAGSFFKNPVINKKHFNVLRESYADLTGFEVNKDLVKIPAAWCIDKAGFKGKRTGEVGAYEKQPLVLVNYGNGTGQQLLSLAREIKSAVSEMFSIELENEVTLMGANGKVSL